jgi:hypothetical protein
MSAETTPHPQTYIIRCWAEALEPGEEAWQWRYVIKHVRTRREKAFSNLADLFAYLALCQDKKEHR